MLFLSQFGHERLQNAPGSQRPVVPEPARQLQGDGASTPQRVGEGTGQGQEVREWAGTNDSLLFAEI